MILCVNDESKRISTVSGICGNTHGGQIRTPRIHMVSSGIRIYKVQLESDTRNVAFRE